MGSKFMHGSSILLGDNTVPGVQLPKEMKDNVPIILQACRDWGLDFYPTVVQLLTYDEISEIAAYGGFPVRYPHWQFGMEYEELQRGYEFGMHKIYEMVINCVKFCTLISTVRGMVEAKDVVVGDVVYSRSGCRRVVAVRRQPVGAVCRLNLKGYGQDTVCTPNHKWSVLRSAKAEWVQAKDLVAGDVLLAGGQYRNFLGRAAILAWSDRKVNESTLPNVRWKLEPILPPSGMTMELAELIGICTGDGSSGVAGAENAIAIAVGHGLDEYKRYIGKLFLSSFGKEAGVYEKHNGNATVQLNSKYAVDFMNELGLKKGVTWESKRIPKAIWESSNEYRAAFLRGLFDTDGHVKVSLSMSSGSEGLIKDVQLMLLEMGIRSRVHHVQNDHNDIWGLYINGRPHQITFAKYVNFSLAYKRDALEKMINSGYAIGHGVRLPKLQQEIVRRISDLPNQRKLPAWIKRWRWLSGKKDFGSNAIWSFVTRLIGAGYSGFGDLLDVLETPMYELVSVESDGIEETVDIALDHDNHDFLANGLISHNTNPCYQWLLSSNSLEDNLTVVAHATGHNDFFKNNIHFSATDTNMLNKMANHGTRIRRYMTRWGKERVVEFIDHVLRLETLIDGAEAWTQKMIRDRNLSDQRKYRHPRRLKVQKERMYMEPFINTRDFRQEENKRIAKADTADEIGLFTDPTKDILGFLRDNAPLKPWQQDIVAMLYEESLYFYPQRQTKVMNEGWASLTDHIIMARQGYIALGQKSHDMGIVEYAAHKMGVLGGKYSMNPYKLGFYLFLDIEERWNKGQFGTEWDECDDIRKKEKWDTGAMQGKEKIFEIRKYYDDLTFLNEFFTEDFCRAQEYFYWKHYPNGEYRLEHRDFKEIKTGLMRRHLNGGLPSIKLTEPNYRGKGYMMLQHDWDGRAIYDPYVRDVMTSLRFLWNNDIFLASKDDDGEEAIYGCYGTAEDDVELVSRKDHMKDW